MEKEKQTTSENKDGDNKSISENAKVVYPSPKRPRPTIVIPVTREDFIQISAWSSDYGNDVDIEYEIIDA